MNCGRSRACADKDPRDHGPNPRHPPRWAGAWPDHIDSCRGPPTGPENVRCGRPAATSRQNCWALCAIYSCTRARVKVPTWGLTAGDELIRRSVESV